MASGQANSARNQILLPGGITQPPGPDFDALRLGRSHLVVLCRLMDEARRKGRVVDDEKLIALWLHGRPATTRRAYLTEITKLRATLPGSLAGAALEDVQRHLESLAGLAPRSINRAYGAIRSFFDFQQRIGAIPANPVSPLIPPKVPQDLAERILPEADISKLISASAAGRDRLILRLLYLAGLRVSELCGLHWRQVAARGGAEGQITVHGKGGRTRVVLLPAELFSEIITSKPAGAAPSDPVFPSPRDPRRALTTTQVARIVKRAAVAAELSPRVSPHWLRHAHVSHALDRGAPVQLVRDTVGHASIATTNKYAHARPNDGSARYLAGKPDQ